LSSPILEGLHKAFELIISLDRGLIEITLRSISISGLATILASCWSLPLGTFIGLKRFKGRLFLRGLFNSLLGVPTVVLGLLIYLLISRTGPLGFMRLLYTPWAVIIGQAILVSPIVVSFVVSTLETVDPEVRMLALTLGASEMKADLKVLEESLGGILLAVTASFNRSIAELGIALMLGGNIRSLTRVLTTTIALETSRGELALSIALAVILMCIVIGVNTAMNLIQRWIEH
jgi:tungstate transport system permease protein